MQEQCREIYWPDNPAPHITDWLLDIGPSVSGAMGEGLIEWRDLDAWCNRIGIDLDPWESRTIRRLSRVFLAQRYDARKPDCPAPYIGKRAEIVSQRDKVAARVKAAFGGLIKAPKKKKKGTKD